MYCIGGLIKFMLMVGIIIITFMVCVVLTFFGLEFIDALNSDVDGSEKMILIFIFIIMVLLIYVDSCNTASLSMAQSGL